MTRASPRKLAASQRHLRFPRAPEKILIVVPHLSLGHQLPWVGCHSAQSVQPGYLLFLMPPPFPPSQGKLRLSGERESKRTRLTQQLLHSLTRFPPPHKKAFLGSRFPPAEPWPHFLSAFKIKVQLFCPGCALKYFRGKKKEIGRDKTRVLLLCPLAISTT